MCVKKKKERKKERRHWYAVSGRRSQYEIDTEELVETPEVNRNCLCFFFSGNTFSANRFLYHGDGKSRGQGCYRSEDGFLWCGGELDQITTGELITSQWSSNQPTKRPWPSSFFPKDESQAQEKHTSWEILNIWYLEEIRFKFCSILFVPGIGCSIFLGRIAARSCLHEDIITTLKNLRRDNKKTKKIKCFFQPWYHNSFARNIHISWPNLYQSRIIRLRRIIDPSLA